ncbi:MAG: lanthionine synthetase C family protein [Streptosporangiaceae bacterium]
MIAGQSLGGGAAGIALVHLETGEGEAAYAALDVAVADGVSVADGASLYYGAPALAFVLSTADQPHLAQAKATATAGLKTVTRHRLEAAHRRIDQQQQPGYAEFDLIRGLTGLGVALRRTGQLDLLREVLTYLVRLTNPLGHLPGWWCHHGPHREDRPGGHSNHGMAHGIAGPLALLAHCYLDGVHVDGHREAIERILRWLDLWQQHTTHGITWWPQTLSLTDLERAEPSQTGPLRPSWCYGTPGIARAIQLAALALIDHTRQEAVEAAFCASVREPHQLAGLDRGLCHGTAGLLATARRIAADARTPIPLTLIQKIHQDTAATDGESTGLLEGTAGIALVDAATVVTGWDICLLLS